MQKYHDEPKQYKGYLKSALAPSSFLAHLQAARDHVGRDINLGDGP